MAMAAELCERVSRWYHFGISGIRDKGQTQNSRRYDSTVDKRVCEMDEYVDSGKGSLLRGGGLLYFIHGSEAV
jgi:hypothetical protein